MKSDYYIGLDCGTESVGFAVTDTEYNILKFRGKAMWGSHIFDEAETAETRRSYRSARRRYMRKKERISLLQSLFEDEISKVDPGFFQRIADSAYQPEDKNVNQRNSLFADPEYEDEDYYSAYPTIFHLRKALIDDEAPADVRLLYLALHHILKNRGHFLFGNRDLNSVMDISILLSDLSDAISAVYDNEIEYVDESAIADAIKLKHMRDKQQALAEQIAFNDKEIKTLIIKAISGSKVKPDKLFGNESYSEIGSIDFSSSTFEDVQLPVFEDNLTDDEYRLLLILKGLYDWGLLASVMEGYPYISYAKVALYEKNGKDLERLKRAVRICSPEKYNEFFHKDKKGKAGVFSAYIGADHSRGKRTSYPRINTDTFYGEVKKMLKNGTDDDSRYILSSIDDGTFMPLIISFRNSVIPYQVHKNELDRILEVGSRHFPFLKEKDVDGLTVIDKIKSIMTYRIPYYVGPIGTNPDMVNGWAVRKKEGKVFPWNFNEMIDTDASAEKFIQRMMSRCTYLPDEYVLPKESLLYSEFEVLNELNIVRVNGERLPVENKEIILKELFGLGRKVTQTRFKKFLIAEGWFDKDNIEISGIDGDFKADLSSYAAFRPYIEEGKLRIQDAEEIIRWITTFSEGGDFAEKRIMERFGSRLSEGEIRSISRLKFAGWGRLSRKFLDGIKAMNRETGELQTIIEAMRSTQHNLMELLDSSYDYVSQTGRKSAIEKLDYSVVDELYVSPAVKRQIWQTLRIIDEIEHIMGHPPVKVFVEVARGEDKEKTRPATRKQKLKLCLESFRKVSPEVQEIIDELDNYNDDAISRRDKLFLYFTQLGRSMYSGKPLNIEEIGNTALYDVDHIYPYSKSDDDSLDNKVIVLKEENSKKSDYYPLADEIRQKMQPFWKKLLDMGLISDKKYIRLIRSNPLTEEDERGFIKRQLVETSQSAKATIDILKRYFGENTTVVYSKARKVSEFRDKFHFSKARSVNNLHHAKDAYLNIVVGNVLHTKYTADFFRRKNIEPNGYYSIDKPFEYNVNGAWRKGAEGTIATVSKYMNRNNILYTVQPEMRSGQLFDLMPLSGGNKLIPRKGSDPALQRKLKASNDPKTVIEDWVRRYGGYNKIAISHFALVSYTEKNRKNIRFVPISIIDRERLSEKEAIEGYCRAELGYENPEVLRARVLMNTKLSIDGFICNITGTSSSGKQIIASSASPLILNDNQCLLIKRVDNFLEKRKIYKDLIVKPEFDKFNEEMLVDLYDTLIEKSKLSIYENRPSNQQTVIEAGRDEFCSLPMESKCFVIQNILRYFAMGSGKSDLSLIKGSPNAGLIIFSAKFDLTKSKVIIYDQSITGLYEKAEEIRL